MSVFSPDWLSGMALLMLVANAQALPFIWGVPTAKEINETIPSTSIPWPGHANIPGAFLLSRISLQFINNTCTEFSELIHVATEVVHMVQNTKLAGSTKNQLHRYGYMLLKLEQKLSDLLQYTTDLLLCPQKVREGHWVTFEQYREASKGMWGLLKQKGAIVRNAYFPDRTPADIRISLEEPTSLVNNEAERVIDPVIRSLEQARPLIKEPRSLLIGLGLGYLGSLLIGSLFTTNNSEEIDKLNINIQKNNKLIRITNERIDLLEKNVRKTNSNFKQILEELIAARKNTDIQLAILWNLDQLVANLIYVKNTFKFAELTTSLLEEKILNAELIDLKSFSRTVEEGKKIFPKLKFPVKIDRYHLQDITKLVKVQRMGHLQFLMIIPLVHAQNYTVTEIVPHPIKIGESFLALPTVKNVILKDGNQSYISTVKENIYSVSLQQHTLLELEPIYSQEKITCEWATFRKNLTEMSETCNYHKVGNINDTIVTQTDKHRFIYFSDETSVDLDCPNKQVRDSLIGLHRFSLSCDIKTDTIYWPASNILKIDLVELNNTTDYESRFIKLPLVKLNDSGPIHDSLKRLLKTLPSEKDKYTIDFDYYGMTLEQVQSYSIYSQTILTVFVTLNSITIAATIFLGIWRRERGKKASENKESDSQTRFKGLRDSIRSKSSEMRSSIKRKVFKEAEQDKSMNNNEEKSQVKINVAPPYKNIEKVYPVLPRYNY